MKNLNMRMKLVVLAIVICFLPMIIIGVTTFVSARNELEKSVLKTNTVFATLTEDQLDSFFSERTSDGNVIAGSDSVMLNMEVLGDDSKSIVKKNAALNNMEQYLTMTLSEYGYTDIFVTDKKGKVIYAVNMKDTLEGAELSSRSYVNSALNDKQTWSKPFYSEVIDDNMIALSNPIYNSERSEVVGTLNILFNQAKLNSIVHRSVEELKGSSDSYLVDDSGRLLTETRLGSYTEKAALIETIDTQATELLSEAIKNGNTNFAYTGLYDNYLGNSVYGSLGVVKFGDKYAGLITEINETEAFGELNDLRVVTIIIIVLFIVFSFVVLILIAKSITRPLASVVNNANLLSEYDLTTDVDQKYLGRKDEIGSIATAIQKVILNLRGLLGEVSKNSELVATSAEELTATSQQSAAGAEEVAATINEIARGATSQADNTTRGSERLAELSRLIEEDKEYIEQMNLTTKTVSEAVQEGLCISDQLALKTNESSDATGVVYESILKTNNSSAKIGEASNMIASIAEQTNLLALNAAIEAARAGEQGKGFAVVAEEIRKLAEQSTYSTKNIDQMVSTLKADAEVAVKKMEEAEEIVKQQEESVKLTIDKYNEIANAMKDTEQAVEILTEAFDIIESKKEDVQDVMQNLSAIAEENAACTEEVSAGIQEQTKSIEEIANASEGLSKLAIEFQFLTEKFKL